MICYVSGNYFVLSFGRCLFYIVFMLVLVTVGKLEVSLVSRRQRAVGTQCGEFPKDFRDGVRSLVCCLWYVFSRRLSVALKFEE